MDNSMVLPQTVLLSTSAGCRFVGGAFDGQYYYFLPFTNCEVFKYDCKFCDYSVIKTSHSYRYICYDNQSCCFWAAEENSNVIYQLNEHMIKVDKFCVPAKCGCVGGIRGLSYNCYQHKLVVAFPKDICVFDLSCKKFEILLSSCRETITGILSIYPALALTVATEKSQRVVIFNECNEPIQILPIPDCGGVLEQVLYFPCHSEPSFIFIETIRGGCSKIIQQSFTKDFIKVCINPCYKSVCRKCCGENAQSPSCDSVSMEMLLSSLCKNDCNDCMPKGCCCCDIEEAEASMLQSIALVEAAIAHILNAEGEKIQKVVKCSENVCDMLSVNREVNQTIVNVIQLEQILYQKIIAIQKCRCRTK